MEHLVYFSNFIVIILGTAGVVYSVFNYKKNHEEFHFAYSWLISLFVIYAIYRLIYDYIVLNLTGTILPKNNINNILAGYNEIYIYRHIFLIIFQVTEVYIFIWIAKILTGKKLSSKFNLIFVTGLILIVVGYFVLTLSLKSFSDIFPIKLFANSIMYISYATKIALLFYVLIKSSGAANFNNRTVKLFASIYIILNLFILSYRNTPVEFWAPLGSVVLLIYVALPFYFIRNILKADSSSDLLSSEHKVDIDNLSNVFKLTSREKEIVLLLADGLNNKEIEKKLFISANTVRNHIYKVYQKLDINSRGQLFSKIQNFNND